MQGLISILNDPFVLGLGLGLLIALISMISGWVARRRIVRENNSLRDMVKLDREIKSEGEKMLLEDLVRLRGQVEKLKITVSTLNNKPGRAELRSLYVHEMAVRLCNSWIPGFAMAWERAWGEAELEMSKTDEGISAWFRRVFRPALPTRTILALPVDDSTNQEKTLKQELKKLGDYLP